ncbi:polysaccharide lyase [Chitinolyticbacter meiyuanensis]|uniref:polysaccharide lyase n=1 Tax=Chitinolyticbacter meiyuanensis TaxID=682798 RepID=UPI0011E5CB96|nr:carbohydrate-binding protein [Chitinolyticbacter meiyuanensis]
MSRVTLSRALSGGALLLLAFHAHAACRGSWAEGNIYAVGDVVSYAGINYTARSTHTAYVGANWNPVSTPTLWQSGGSCGATPVPTPTSVPATPTPRPTATPLPTSTPVPVSTPTPQPTTTPAPSATPTPAGSACYPGWAAASAYTGGQRVTYGGRSYEAKWWTQGDNPAQSGEWGVWKDLGACGGTITPTTNPTAVPTPSATPRPTATPTATPVPTVSPTPILTPTPIATPTPGPTPQPGSALLDVRFDNHVTGVYTANQFQSDWNSSPSGSSGVSAGRLSVVADPNNAANKVLRVTYKGGEIGGNSASVFDVPLPAGQNHLFLQYKLRFDNAFTWVKGGKLPGLGGADTPTGCIDNGTFDGFTTRNMWRENGLAFQYLYFPGKAERCGDYFSYAKRFEVGRWYTITQEVQLNDAGQANGWIKAWLDGEPTLALTGMKWREGAAVGIDALVFHTFFGGSTADWAPASDQYAYFDNVRVSTGSPLALVDTQKPKPAYSNPLSGYAQWEAGKTYAEGSYVYRIDGGVYRYFKARYYVAANIDPLNSSIPEVHVGVYSPKLDNGEKWMELTAPWQ